VLYYKLNDGSFLTRWKVEFDSELTSKQMKAVIDLVKKYNSANPKWKAWTNKSLTKKKYITGMIVLGVSTFLPITIKVLFLNFTAVLMIVDGGGNGWF